MAIKYEVSNTNTTYQQGNLIFIYSQQDLFNFTSCSTHSDTTHRLKSKSHSVVKQHPSSCHCGDGGLVPVDPQNNLKPQQHSFTLFFYIFYYSTRGGYKAALGPTLDLCGKKNAAIFFIRMGQSGGAAGLSTQRT